MTKKEIGSILQTTRLRVHMTQLQVAEKIGRPQQTIAAWETGRSQPDANTLFDLFGIYGVSLDEAFGFESKKTINLENFAIDNREKCLIEAYRAQPAMQAAVDRILGLASSAEPPSDFKLPENFDEISEKAKAMAKLLNQNSPVKK